MATKKSRQNPKPTTSKMPTLSKSDFIRQQPATLSAAAIRLYAPRRLVEVRGEELQGFAPARPRVRGPFSMCTVSVR
jgi:hypothetical protein